MQTRPILVDTDPGIDDAIALLVLRHYCPEAVRLILASYGNIALEQAVRNAGVMTSLLQWEVPVLRGAAGPADPASQYVTATHIHGSDGLAGVSTAYTGDTKEEICEDYLQEVYDTLQENGCCDYIVLGPMTNLALLLRRFPDARTHIGRVVCMGGGFGMGNVTSFAEFNLHCDAVSAGEVLAGMENIALVPLNVTTPVAFSLEEIERITAEDTILSVNIKRLLTECYNNCVRWGEQGATMHDSTAVLYALFPELFTVRQTGVTVACTAEQYGQTTETDQRRNVTLVERAEPRVLLDRIAVCL